MDDVDEAIESAIKNIGNAPQEEPDQKETMKRAFENRVSEDVSNDVQMTVKHLLFRGSLLSSEALLPAQTLNAVAN